MKTNTGGLPLILREESFGGMLFDPDQGTLLELDPDALKLVSAFFKDKKYVPAKDEKRFLAALKKEISYHRSRRVHIVHNTQVTERGTPAYSFPVLSAPTLLDFQITNRCYMNCSHCYASSTPGGGHVALEDVHLVLTEAQKCGVCQVALGGGEPLLHPCLPEILALCHHTGMVPNLSTSGMHLTEPVLSLLRKYCGAVAVSLENTGDRLAQWRKIEFIRIKEALQKLKAASIPTVIQVTLSASNFGDLPDITDFCLSQAPLYGVIFLAYKPVGRGRNFSRPLAALDAGEVSRGLRTAFQKLSGKMRVGYDCCLSPALAGFVHPDYLEGCSALRGSAGVSPELNVIPCTFLPQRVIGNLKQETLAGLWLSPQATTFRDSLKAQVTGHSRCSGCSLVNSCLAGCPVMQLVPCCL